MARSRSSTLTERESQIMTILWERGSASANEVREALAADLRESTVRTLIGILEDKGYARHRVESRTYIYEPIVPRERVQRSVLRGLLESFFAGSAEELVQRLIEDKHITPKQLELLSRKSQQIRRRRP